MITKTEIVEKFLETKESEKIQLDNLDWAKLVFNSDSKLVMENEHGTQFDINDLSEIEREVLYANI